MAQKDILVRQHSRIIERLTQDSSSPGVILLITDGQSIRGAVDQGLVGLRLSVIRAMKVDLCNRAEYIFVLMRRRDGPYRTTGPVSNLVNFRVASDLAGDLSRRTVFLMTTMHVCV